MVVVRGLPDCPGRVHRTLGIELSAGLLIVLGVIETLIVVALAIAGFADPGPGGVNFQWLNPQNAPSGHALFLGVVFAIFAIAGWDAAAPLGEESEDPKKTIPRGVVGCIIILGLLLFFASWGQITGWGTDNIAQLPNSSELPAFVLGHEVLGRGLGDRPARAAELSDRRRDRRDQRSDQVPVRDG